MAKRVRHATSVFDFEAPLLDGSMQPLKRWKGHPLLIVNVASRCGFTPQYAGLEQLWRDYGKRGLVVLGFPCNQFGRQEPGDAEAIASFCSLTYEVSFPMFAKVDVNGGGAHPLWAWLQRERSGLLGSAAIKWNFTKFLTARDGSVIGRYAPATPPAALRDDIEAALA